jgi:DNA repair protein SbcD/Mre11
MYDSSYNGSVRVIHAADLHLDSPCRGLERYEGAPVEEVSGATRAAFVNLVDYALQERVALILLAGDIYDGDWRDYNTGLFFAAQLARLADAGVRVVLVSGNHDADSVITRHLPLPANTTLLAHATPERVLFEELGIAVTGQSFSLRETPSDLAAGFPAPAPGYLNFALLHTSADGRPGHERYAPCNPRELALRGYDYWALGHVHRREIINEHPWIVFAGNLQGRQVREAGPKGFYLIETRAGEIGSVQAVDADVVRWSVLEIDAAEATSVEEVVALFADRAAQAIATAEGRPVAARVLISGATSTHATLVRDGERLRALLCEVALELAGPGLWLEQVQLRTSAATNTIRLARADEAETELLETLRDVDEQALVEALADSLNGLRSRLPLELRTDEDGVEIGSAEHVRALLPQIQSRLRSELTGEAAA